MSDDVIEAPEFSEVVTASDLWASVRHHLEAGRLVVLLPDGMTIPEGKEEATLCGLGMGSHGMVFVARRPKDAS